MKIPRPLIALLTVSVVIAGIAAIFVPRYLEKMEKTKTAATIAQLNPKCVASTPKDQGCWVKLSMLTDCYFWGSVWHHGFKVIWLGECKSGVAHGSGVLGMLQLKNEQDTDNKLTRREVGEFVDGKKHGTWEHETIHGTSAGTYVEGKRHGEWRSWDSVGQIKDAGAYAKGEKHGMWTFWNSRREIAETGPYFNGNRHGYWRGQGWSDKGYDGYYHKGVKHGKWTEDWLGWMSTGNYVNGVRDGYWERDLGKGTQEKGYVVDGKQHGQWSVRLEWGNWFLMTYANGVRQK